MVRRVSGDAGKPLAALYAVAISRYCSFSYDGGAKLAPHLATD